MARQRDVTAQRAQLSTAVWQVLAEDGLPGLTVRAVAERAGCTTGLVMHAFPSKKALLLHARDLLYARTAERLDAAEDASRTPADALRAVVAVAMDSPASRHEEARVWIGFLAAALADDDLAEHHRKGNRSFVARVERLVAACRPEWGRARLERSAKALVALVEGFNVLSVADPSTFPARLQKAAMTAALDEIALAAG